MATNQSDKAAMDALNELDSLDGEMASAETSSRVDSSLSEPVSDVDEKLPRLSVVEFDGTMSELNRFLSSVYTDMSEIDPMFKQASNFFMERANEWGEAAEKTGKGIDSDEGKIAVAIAAVGLAMNGLGRIVKLWEQHQRLNQYRQICQNIAKTKGPHIDSMVALSKRAVNDALEELQETVDQQIDSLYSHTQPFDSFSSVKELLMSNLNRCRQAQYVFDQMIWLRDQIIAWNEGKLEDTSSPYPSYDAINRWLFFAIHPIEGKSIEEASRKEREAVCDEVVDEYIKMTGNVYNSFSGGYLMTLCDNEMMATLLDNCEKNTKYKLFALYEQVDPQALNNALEGELVDSDAIKTSHNLAVQSKLIKEREETHETLLCCNGLLLIVMASLPIFALTNWAWYWKTLLCIVFVVLIGYRTIKAITNVEEKTKIKLKMIDRWERTCIKKMIGYKPKSQSVTRIHNSMWTSIICAVIGGVIGSFIFPVLGTIGGILIGALFGGNSNEKEESDGRNWSSFETGNMTKTKTWAIILAIFLIVEIYWLFF